MRKRYLIPAAAIAAASFGYAVRAQTDGTSVSCTLDDNGTLSCPGLALKETPPSTTVPAGTTVPATGAPTTTTTSLPATSTTAPTTTAAPATTTTVRPTTTTVAPSTTVPAAGSFSEDFTSPSSVDRFTFQTSFGTQQGAVPSDPGEHIMGDHDMSCGAPTTQRDVDLGQPAQMVWYCAPGGDPSKGHIMTAAASVGYAQVAFSPKQSFNNVHEVCWDINFTEMGGRKWIQVAIVPEADFQKNHGALNYAEQGLMPAPASGFLSVGGGGLLIREQGGTTTLLTTSGPSGPTFGPGAIVTMPDTSHDMDAYSNGLMTSDKATRYTQCISDTPQGVHMEKDTPLGHRSGTTSGVRFPQGQVRVIFQDDTYDNYKGGLGDATQGTDPRVTWHWDNITIK